MSSPGHCSRRVAGGTALRHTRDTVSHDSRRFQRAAPYPDGVELHLHASALQPGVPADCRRLEPYARQLRRIHTVQPLAVQRAGHRGAARAADALAGASAHYAALGPVHPDTRFPSLRFGALTFVGVRVPRSHRRRLHPPLARQVYMPRYTDTLSKQASFCSARRSGAQHFSHKPGAWCSGHGSITLPRWSYRCICYSERWSIASEIAGLSLTRLPACLPFPADTPAEAGGMLISPAPGGETAGTWTRSRPCVACCAPLFDPQLWALVQLRLARTRVTEWLRVLMDLLIS